MTNIEAAERLERLATFFTPEVSNALRLGASALRESEWLDIAGAPKGCVTEDVGCRGESEWFLVFFKNGDIRKIKRLPESHAYTWCDSDRTYYRADWVTHYRPLPSPPKEQGNG